MVGKGKANFSRSDPCLIISHSKIRKLPNEELANESRSTHITVAADMVFSLSHYLSGVRTIRVRR
jgi:brefeldin A-inhibited guanine nucleotide-exchange protein